MEEDTNVSDSSTSAKRSKLEDDISNTESNNFSQNEASSTVQDIEMLENSEDTILIENETHNLNQKIENNKIKIDSLENNCDGSLENKESIDKVKNLNEITESSALEIDKTKPSEDNINGNDVPLEDEIKETASTSNSGEQEAGPSESGSVKKPRNRNRHYRPRRISSSDNSLNNSFIDNADANDTNNSNTSDHESEESNHTADENDSDAERSSHVTDTFSFSSDLNYMESNESDEDEPASDEMSSIQEFLTKSKPKYNANLFYEVMYREHGLSGSGLSSKRRKDPMLFQSTIRNSRLTIEKLRVVHNLRKHRGCVNSLNFNRSGNILCTGSDDLKIILWNWANNKMVHSFLSGHNLNVFQAKFVDIDGGINIVSSARDGQVRHQILPPSGSTKNISTVLFKHSGPVHKIATCPMNPYEILTAGEDAYIVRCDLREKPVEKLITVKGKNNQRVELYSIAHNPLDQEFCVSGRDGFVRVYDKRNVKTPVYLMCPEKFSIDNKHQYSHITCAVYNQTGNEILASYHDGDIYLFNNKCYLKGHFTHQYRGHLNYKTIKGVNFFGPNSEYIVSGSDCGNLFIWDKETEVILNWQKGDRSGVVNCLEPHPCFPVLATSGLDYDVKIWSPISEVPPEMEGLEKCVKQNARRLASNRNDIFNNRTFMFFINACQRNRRVRLLNRPVYGSDDGDNCPLVQSMASSSSSDHSTDVEDDDEVRNPCTTH